jgi:hypothetical protein
MFRFFLNRRQATVSLAAATPARRAGRATVAATTATPRRFRSKTQAERLQPAIGTQTLEMGKGNDWRHQCRRPDQPNSNDSRHNPHVILDKRSMGDCQDRRTLTPYTRQTYHRSPRFLFVFLQPPTHDLAFNYYLHKVYRKIVPSRNLFTISLLRRQLSRRDPVAASFSCKEYGG